MMIAFRIQVALVITLMLFATISCIKTSQSKDDGCESTASNSLLAEIPTATDDTPDNPEKHNHTKDNEMDHYLETKEFWTSNRTALESVSKDMLLLGIDYIAEGKGYIIENENVKEIDINNIESIAVLIKELDGRIDQIGWSLPGDPLFPNGEQYFYCETPIFAINGNEISYTLVFSENSIEDMDPYTIYEVLSSNWILVTNYFGE